MLLPRGTTLSWLLSLTTCSSALNLPPNPSNLFAPSTAYNLSTAELTLISTLNNSTAPPSPPPLLNLTVPNLPPASRNVEVKCSFGHELEYNACLDALNQFVYPPTRSLTIGPRRALYARWDLELPVRWLSGKNPKPPVRLMEKILTQGAGDGFCSFDLVKHGQAHSTTATDDEIVSAATALINRCVLRGDGQGGIASNIGKHAFSRVHFSLFYLFHATGKITN